MDSILNAGKDLLAKQTGGGGGDNNQSSGGGGGGDMFSSVLNSVMNNQDQHKDGDVDEKEAADNHDQVYNKGDNNSSVNAMGTAAAMQALKKFTSGSNDNSGGKNDFVSLAMGEASKLFDNKASEGSVANGADKQSVIQKAAEVAMKLYFKSQMQQSGGGLGGLANMASKFIK